MKKMALTGIICVLAAGMCLPKVFQFTAAELVERAKWEDFLRTAEIVDESLLAPRDPEGSPRKLTLEKNGITAQGVWRNIEGRFRGFLEGWKWEIAAYRLDKYLNLNMVPPTVEREVGGKPGCLQLWVTVETDAWIVKRDEIPIPSYRVFSYNRATYLQRAFDNLIANYDRHGGNVLLTKDWRMILVDHSRSFGTTKKSTTTLIYTEDYKDGPKVMKSLPRVFVERLKGLDVKAIKDTVGSYLTDAEIDAVLKRRDLILVEIARLIELHGEDNVLY